MNEKMGERNEICVAVLHVPCAGTGAAYLQSRSLSTMMKAGRRNDAADVDRRTLRHVHDLSDCVEMYKEMSV